MRRVPIAPPGEMFWSRDLIREELDRAERGYPFQDYLEGAYFSYMAVLVLQLIDSMASDFIPPLPPPSIDPIQTLSSRVKTSQAP